MLVGFGYFQPSIRFFIIRIVKVWICHFHVGTDASVDSFIKVIVVMILNNFLEETYLYEIIKQKSESN